jgi:predicted RecB family nuclease
MELNVEAMHDSSAMQPQLPKLSKSRFMAGLQCPKRVYLECHAGELASPPDAMIQATFDAGHAVGALARERFPGGVLIANGHHEHEIAEEVTRSALANPAVPAIYEAAFTHADIRIRADVLVRRSGEWFDLVEVKSTASVKPEHAWDLAVQLHVLEGAGVKIHRAFLMHLDRSYVYPGGPHELDRLFACQDLTEGVRARQDDVRRALAEMRLVLGRTEAPAIAVGDHCERPYTCSFYDHCHQGLPPDPFADLPRMTARLRERFAEAGIDSIAAIPSDFPRLKLVQRRAIEALRAGQRVVDPALREVLSSVRFPVHFLDFETFMPPIPLYAGTRPYDVIPFQWSDHVLDENGVVDHREFLHPGGDDPRREFAERLLEATAGEGSVVVYSNFEDTRLGDLESALPDLRDGVGKLRGRLFDLLPVIRRHVYDPGFGGSFSIKAVLPAMIPELGYDDLEIQHGGLASVAFAEILRPETTAERREELRAHLRAYCQRDTEAMLELFRLLR